MYTFCLINTDIRFPNLKGWYLSIDNIEDLVKFYNGPLSSEIIKDWDDLHNHAKSGSHFTRPAAHALYNRLVYLTDKSGNENKLFEITEISDELANLHFNPKAKLLMKYGRIFIGKNKLGFLHNGPHCKILRTVTSKEYKWPDENLIISIKQFPNGTHYYISIAGENIEVDEKLKWDHYYEVLEAVDKIKKWERFKDYKITVENKGEEVF